MTMSLFNAYPNNKKCKQTKTTSKSSQTPQKVTYRANVAKILENPCDIDVTRKSRKI